MKMHAVDTFVVCAVRMDCKTWPAGKKLEEAAYEEGNERTSRT